MGRRIGMSRSTVAFLSCVLAVPTVASIMYGEPHSLEMDALAPYLATGAALGLAHLIVRPVLRLLTAPLGCVTFGLSGTAIDVGLIYLSGKLVRGFQVPEFLYALLTALLINLVVALLGKRRA